MANNLAAEKQLSTIIYDDFREGIYNEKNYKEYIDLVLINKFKNNKELLLKDNILNLISSIIYKENDLPDDIINFLKSYLKEVGILDYLDNLKYSDTSRLYELYDTNKYKEINKELYKYYGKGITLDTDFAIDLLFRHFDDESFILDETSIKVILESICYDKLDYLGIDEHICFFCDKSTIRESLLGEYNDGNKSILMNDINIDKLVNFDIENINDKTFGALETLFHECEHANQFIGEKNLSFLNMIIAKDVILKWYGPEFYYNANYREISFEILARKKEVTDTFRFLTDYNPLLSDRYYDTMMKQLETENELLKDTRDPYHKFNDGDSNFDFLDQFVSRTIAKKPQVLEDYPILKYEFNSDGTKKSLSSIFNSINDIEHNSELYEYTFSLLNYAETYGDDDCFNFFDEIVKINTNDEIIVKQISYKLMELIDYYDYIIENYNGNKRDYLIRFKDTLNDFYKFTNYNNKFSVKLKQMIDERIEKLNNLDLDVKEL